MLVNNAGGAAARPFETHFNALGEEDVYKRQEKIRNCGKEFCLSTFSLTDKKELTLSVADIEDGLLEDFLLASAYLIGFKNEPLHGKKYTDGGLSLIHI